MDRYDPDTHVSEEIDTEDDRVEFLTSVAAAMATKAKIKLNTKRLYAADGRAVKELLKVAEMLYSASRANVVAEEEAEEVDAVGLPSQIKNIKGARALATDITERGARLFDLLGKERDVRVERSRALRFLDAISGNLDSTSEESYVAERARDLVAGLKEAIEGMRKQCRDLEADEKGLGEKIKRKQAELERHEKRLLSLASVRPAFMDEFERLEKDLVKHYEGYLERFRNLDFLEHELDLYHKVKLPRAYLPCLARFEDNSLSGPPNHLNPRAVGAGQVGGDGPLDEAHAEEAARGGAAAAARRDGHRPERRPTNRRPRQGQRRGQGPGGSAKGQGRRQGPGGGAGVGGRGRCLGGVFGYERRFEPRLADGERGGVAGEQCLEQLDRRRRGGQRVRDQRLSGLRRRRCQLPLRG